MRNAQRDKKVTSLKHLKTIKSFSKYYFQIHAKKCIFLENSLLTA